MAPMTTDEQEGPAVLGADEIVCWTPCHRKAVRIERSLLRQRSLTIACPQCGEIWRVRFRRDQSGLDLVAVWTYEPSDLF
ncbi:MAG: hypothetical protein ACRDZ4_07660 [Egibacteraceae bacterium]